MNFDADYASLVAKAEQAVAAVKDPELRRIAFQKILDSLLADEAAGAKSKVRHDKAPKEHSRVARKQAGKRKRGVAAYLLELVDDGFFKKQKTITEVKAELENRGHHIPLTSLSGPLQQKCKDKILRRQKKVSGNKQTFAYSNW